MIKFVDDSAMFVFVVVEYIYKLNKHVNQSRFLLDFLFGFIFLQLFQMLITAGLISQQKQDKALQKPIRKKSSTKLHFFFTENRL